MRKLLENEFVEEEIITEFNVKNVLRGFIQIDEKKQIHNDVLIRLGDICSTCGISVFTGEWYGVEKYELRFYDMHPFFKDTDLHKSLFHKMYYDAFDTKMNIFTHQIVDGQRWTAGDENDFHQYPVQCINYKNHEDMLRDMISAANFINENLKEERE